MRCARRITTTRVPAAERRTFPPRPDQASFSPAAPGRPGTAAQSLAAVTAELRGRAVPRRGAPRPAPAAPAIPGPAPPRPLPAATATATHGSIPAPHAQCRRHPHQPAPQPWQDRRQNLPAASDCVTRPPRRAATGAKGDAARRGRRRRYGERQRTRGGADTAHEAAPLPGDLGCWGWNLGVSRYLAASRSNFILHRC